MDHVYWGQSYQPDEIRSTIEASGLPKELINDESRLVDLAVDRLLAGKVVGWFQGRFEWGPRALGNRSILADPRRADMKDIVNNKIKFREPFRPFAPSVLSEAAGQYFELPTPVCPVPANFMLLVVPVRPDMGETIPAVDHLGTARIQTVRRDHNPLYYDVIHRCFGEASGVPVVLNT